MEAASAADATPQATHQFDVDFLKLVADEMWVPLPLTREAATGATVISTAAEIFVETDRPRLLEMRRCIMPGGAAEPANDVPLIHIVAHILGAVASGTASA